MDHYKCLTNGNVGWLDQVVTELQVAPCLHAHGCSVHHVRDVLVVSDQILDGALVAHNVTFELPVVTKNVS